jgi:CheY-like chemotaxis protein
MYPRTLALVDDDREYSDYLAQHLRVQGIDVHLFGDSNQLLARADAYDFGFYLLDLMLPGVDGVDLIKILRLRTTAGLVVVSGVIVLFVQIDTADTRNSKQINHFRKAPQAEGQSNASACQGTYFRCEVHQSARKVRLPRMGARYVRSHHGYGESATVALPAYTLFDAMLGYDFASWSLALNARNLTDKTTVSTCSYGSCSYGDVRRVTATATYRW